jgi:hypothetical protein
LPGAPGGGEPKSNGLALGGAAPVLVGAAPKSKGFAAPPPDPPGGGAPKSNGLLEAAGGGEPGFVGALKSNGEAAGAPAAGAV